MKILVYGDLSFFRMEVIDDALKFVYDGKHSAKLLLLFPCLLTFGLVVKFFLFVFAISIDPQATLILNSGSFLNQYLAGTSFQSFASTVVSVSVFVLVFKVAGVSYREEGINSYLPLTTRDVSSEEINKKQLIIRQLSKLAILFTWIFALIIWFFGDSLYDKFLKYTGGHCSNEDFDLNYRECRSLDPENTWVGGIKFSGHSLILSCFTMSLIYEFRSVYRIHLINRLNSISNYKEITAFHTLLAIFLLLCSCWIALFLITAVFYHTILEKIVGLSCGLLIPYLFYVKFNTKLTIL